MITVIIWAFLAGVFAANGVPHFIKGITHERFPTPFGGGPIPNLIGGWLMFVIAAGCVVMSDARTHLIAAFWSAALGVLGMGLFHAGPGAFGKK